MSSSVADDGPGVLGSIFETLLRTGGARPPQTVESKDPTLAETLWSVLRVLVLVFLILRMALWAVRAGSRAGSRSAQLLQRIWLMLEGSTWALTVVWIVTRVAARESVGAAVLAVMVVVLLLAVSWTALLDVAAGIVLAAERPFGVGDFVQIQRRAQIIEGQVRALRSRVMEIETRGGLRMRLPYRWAAGATAVRPGGGRTAHAVTLTLELPESMEPSEGLRVAEALAASAPWAALGLPPRVEMTDEPVSALRVQAYAFSEAAEPLLRASLVAGWRDIVRKAKSVDSAPRVP